ncbi:MAG: T9SS type A sorting domain-containing protein [Chitinophagales bacterium]|nr:T9SS type A sorting domain-containing protein [Chitinophagales bacterium]
MKIQKTDTEGNLLWKTVYSQTGKSISSGLFGPLEKINDSYWLCGGIYDTATQLSNSFLCRIDTAGNVFWTDSFGVSNKYETAYHGSKTNDNGYIMIGESYTPGVTNPDYYVIKTDTSGALQWEKTYGGTGDNAGYTIHQTLDNGFIMAGGSSDFGIGEYSGWVVKTDSLGEIEWDEAYGTSGSDGLGRVSPSQDSGYFHWGYLDTVVSNVNFRYVVVIIKLNETGEVQWRTFFNYRDMHSIKQVRELSDGSIVAIGEVQVGSADSSAAWIAKLNAGGEILWERYYLNDFYSGITWSKHASFFGDFQQTPDGGFAIAGALWKAEETRPNARYPHVWLVKLDSLGCLENNCGLLLDIQEIQSAKSSATIVAYPNPFSTQTLISIKTNSAEYANEKIEFQLFDVSGRLVQASSHTLNQYGYCEFYVERGHYPADIYFYQVTTQKAVLGKGKIVAR